MIANADREQDTMLGSVLDGDGGGEAEAIRREDGHEAVVWALVVGSAGIVVGRDGRGGSGFGACEATLEGGHMGTVLRRPKGWAR